MPGGFNVWGPKELDTIERLSTHTCNVWHTLADSGEITTGNIDNMRPPVVCMRVGKTDAERQQTHRRGLLQCEGWETTSRGLCQGPGGQVSPKLVSHLQAS